MLAAFIKRRQFCSVSWLVWNISTTIKCFAMKFAADIKVPMRTNPTDIGDSLTFPRAPQAGQSFHWNMSTSSWWIDTNIQTTLSDVTADLLNFPSVPDQVKIFTLSSTVVYDQVQNSSYWKPDLFFTCLYVYIVGLHFAHTPRKKKFPRMNWALTSS